LKKVIFNLSRFWPLGAPREQQIEPYAEIESGRKNIEWRENNEFWRKRLLSSNPPSRAWFVVGYPKGNLPRLEATIVDIVPHEALGKIEIRFANIEEVTK